MNADSYKELLTSSMTELGNKPDTIFIGQQLLWYGNPMSSTIINVPKEKIIEVPVMEESQMGMSLGLAMTGNFVISFYPRWDFLLCATNQLVNHLDKIELMSNDQWRPNIIIRIGKGSTIPLDPGWQHRGDYGDSFNLMLHRCRLFEITNKKDIKDIYEQAYEFGGITLIVEFPELYND